MKGVTAPGHDVQQRRLPAARGADDAGEVTVRLTFQLFAQSPPFAHLLAVYNNDDFSGPLDLVRRAAELSEDAVPGSERVRV
jgi:4-hydroxyphenylacetate 3-monooxygenase